LQYIFVSATGLTKYQEAIEGWKTPGFAPYFHQTGHLVTVSGQAPVKAVKQQDEAFEYVTEHPILGPAIQPINTRAEFNDYARQVTGPLNGFKGYFNRLEGYAHSSNCLKGIYSLLAEQGVKFMLGPNEGHVVNLIYEGEAGNSLCTGVRTKGGKVHAAQVTICALGGYGASLIPLLSGFNLARCWSVAHIQLTDAECNVLRGLPIVTVRDLGFYFEPDPATRLLKLCPLWTGYGNTDARSGIYLPPLHGDDYSQNSIPFEQEQQLRTLLRETLPWLANRPFVDTKFCWFWDTSSSEHCIDFVPDTDKSLVVLSGDSGHGFKMMPIIGEWLVDLLVKGEQQLPRRQW
jgi:sarcosine oxidase/L-pipecolate oxidase